MGRNGDKRRVTGREVTRGGEDSGEKGGEKRLCSRVYGSMVAFTAYSQKAAEPTEPMTSS